MFFRVVLLFIFLFNCFLYSHNKKFKVSFDPDYAPFSYLENNKAEGLLVDYWKLWAEKNDYEIEFVNGKVWNKAINLAKASKVDFFIGTNVYEKWMKASIPYYKTQSSLFIHKENSKDLNHEASYIIALIGDAYKEHIKSRFPKSEIIIYDDYNTLFKDFLSKKIDLIYDDKIAIEVFALRNNYFHIVRSIDLGNESWPMSAISKNKEYVEIFSKGLKNLSQEELYDIESKWIINKKQRFYKNKGLYLTKEEKEFIKNNIIKISTSKAWKPFNYEENEKPAGIAFELWKIISQKTGLKSTYTFYDDFTKQLNSIKTKKEDIIYSVGETKERKKYALFSNTYYNVPFSIATSKDENFIEDISFILDKTIAVGENFTAHKIIKEQYPNAKLLLVKSIKKGLQAVLDKKAYAYIDSKPNLEYNINKLNFKNLKITGNTGISFNLKIMIRDDYALLKSIIDKTLFSLEEKELDSIIAKWSNIHFEKDYDYKRLWLVLGISVVLIMLVLYKEYTTSKENKKLENLVDERTKDLQKLTQSLELIVKDKTKELKRVNYILDEAQKIANLGSFQYHLKKKELNFSNELFKILQVDKNTKPTIDLALKYIHEDDKDNVSKMLQKAVLKRKTISINFRIIVKNRIKYIQLNSKITRFDEQNNPVLVIGTILNLTKLKNLEMEKREKETILAQQSKMAAMGEMLENIAHQWRQPLSVISTASTGLQLKLEFSEEVPKNVILENISTINHQAQYLSKTIEDFRNFFNPNKIKTEFNIKTCIEKTLYLIKQKLNNNNVQIIKDLEDINLIALENELIQVLLNIINNAVDAFDKKQNNYIFITTKQKYNNLLIEIKDNAKGVNPKIINRIFEPYFTTKHKAQGTGIGLYMSNEIITKHMYGFINVTNKSYTYDNIDCFGASFTITIPLKAKKQR